MKYWNHHNHTDMGSNLRMLDCICKTEMLIDRAIELGYSGLSITDHSSISSHIEAIKHVKKLKEKGIDFKLGLGVEEYVVESLEETRDNYQSGVTKFPHMIFIAKDKIGYEQLRKIDSKAWDNSFYTGKMRRTPITKQEIEEIIGEEKGHILCSTACLGGELAQLSLEYLEMQSTDKKIKIDKFVKWCISVFRKENFAFELQPSDQEQQIEYNKFLLKLSQAYGIKAIITTDTHYINKEDKEVHRAFLTSRDSEERELGDFYNSTYLQSLEQMWEYFKEYISKEKFNSLIVNSYEFGRDIEFIDMEHKTIIPERNLSGIDFKVKHTFENWYDKYEYIKNYAYSEYEQDRYLLYMIEEGFLNKKQEFNKENINRINLELKELWLVSEALDDRMSAYYNLVDYIVDICWTIGFLGISRGSVTGYYTMYLIDIHQMNPIEWKLPYWRHLNAQRVSFPDVDLDSSAKNRSKIVQKLKETFGEDNILNIATFRTETSKSAIKTSCRGLGINSDEADFLASLVKIERGKQWSIHDCFYGNEEKAREPNIELLNEIQKCEETYDVDLKRTIEMIDGIVSGLSLHASGIYIFKDGYIAQNSKMKTPRGDNVTAWSMEDSDYCGGLKYDSLTTECQDKLEVCIDYLLKDGKIEWQGSYRETYNKYLHPDVINYTNKEMWEECGSGKVIDLFQFITPVGGACIKKVQPQNLVEMSNANSLMRISVKNGEQPIDKFIRYKGNIQLWYDELKEYEIEDKKEIEALEKILLPNYGIANTQEDIMELVQEPKISGFTLAQADKMRKIVAKKLDKEVAHLKEDFYKNGRDLNNSENVLNYVWEQCITPQLNYSFSRNHVMPYSAEALQELNLYHFYPHCYWNCATLAVNAGSVDITNEYDDIDYDIEENTKSKGTDYGKIAKAIYRSKTFGVSVLPPCINKSQLSFTPIEEDSTIRFGLAGISGINQDIARDIIDGRPYTSFKQFYEYHKQLQIPCEKDGDGQPIYRNSLVTKSKIINLIKSGCFDCFNSNRVALMKWLCFYENPNKESLTMANINKAIEYGVEFPKDLIRAYRYKQYIVNKSNFVGIDPNFKSKKLYIVEPTFALPYFKDNCMDVLEENKDYYYDEGNNLIVNDKSLEKALKPKLDALKKILSDEKIIELYNKKRLQSEYKTMVSDEDVNKWAFESICFYDKEHELSKVDISNYSITPFSQLPEVPTFIEKHGRGNRTWKQFNLSRICGTILGRNDNKNSVDVLTPDEEVVTVKMTQGQFGFYKKVISVIENGNKTIIEDSWLKRGNKIAVVGYRRDDGFTVKNYTNSPFQHSVALIRGVNEDNSLDMQLERYNPNEED